MKKIAIFNEDGIIEKFEEKPLDHKESKNELPVEDIVPEIPEGFELFGPNYMIEKDKVYTVYELQPIDETTPERLLARIQRLEEMLKR